MTNSKRESLVSVVIPVYNAAGTIIETVESALGQDYSNIEIVIVNDGSTDDSEKLLLQYGDRIRYYSKQNGGLAEARNYGMARAKGDYVAWLDADDIWEKEKVSIQVRILESDRKVALCCTDFSAFNESGIFDESHGSRYYAAIGKLKNGLSELYPETDELIDSGPGTNTRVKIFKGDIYDKLVWGNVIHPPTVMIRRNIIEQVDGLDPAMAQGADYEYFIRTSRLGKIAHVDMPLLRYRYSIDQMSSDRNIASISAANTRVLRKVAENNPDFVRQHKKQYRRRLGNALQSAAAGNVDHSRLVAWSFLTQAMLAGQFNRKSITILVKLLLPGVVLNWARSVRGTAIA